MNKNRVYKYQDRGDIISHLAGLLSPQVSVSDYQNEMYSLGQLLADCIGNRVSINSSYCVVSTAEDADFLAKGVIDGLLGKVKQVKLACFWNYHSTPINGGVSTAPIIKKFIETGAESSDNLIVVKSIISGSCVVKTNLTALIESMDPKKIFILSPVMHVDAATKLESDFPKSISKRFDFEYLAMDKLRDPETNEVSPGIGGSVYKLLGFGSQESKNNYTPELVKARLFV